MKKIIATTTLASTILIGGLTGFAFANDNNGSITELALVNGINSSSDPIINEIHSIIGSETLHTTESVDSLVTSDGTVVLKYDGKGGIFDTEGNEISKEDYFRILGTHPFSIGPKEGVGEDTPQEVILQMNIAFFIVDSSGKTTEEISEEISEAQDTVGTYREARKLGIKIGDKPVDQVMNEITNLRHEGITEINDPYFTAKEYNETLNLAKENGIKTDEKRFLKIQQELAEKLNLHSYKTL
ncbi:hypothetical protein [Chengkuizengella marina]|uniref:Uncharacterized protein n=1 Tax=Chengkuizengella marina TaxID=2507566 RepID=A0A6N9Q5T7_9BACL|nr:hypothetical protein [Chengkuizengella marina]NBI30187.1 hypothetical protein [Chengkuizengella marina]